MEEEEGYEPLLEAMAASATGWVDHEYRLRSEGQTISSSTTEHTIHYHEQQENSI